MITLHPISAGSGIDYLMRTVASGDVPLGRQEAAAYWSSGGDTPGVWLGRQATDLGLTGRVAEDAANAVFKDGVDPATGAALGRLWPRYPTAEEHFAALLAAEPAASAARREQLREQAEKVGNRTARSGWEMVCSPVKSFALLWGTADDATRERLEAVERAAFHSVFDQLEREACWTRSGPGGVVRVAGRGLIAAAFEHRSSRAGDPDWHRHVAISAKVHTEDGRWLALDARPLHRLVVSLSARYTAEIERGMHREFGVLAAPRADTVRPDRRPVREFLGVPDAVVRAFSARRAQTERQLAGLLAEFRQLRGREPSRAEEYELAQRATLTARPDKQAHDREGERARWRAGARRLGVRHPERWLRRARRASRAHRRETVPLPVVAARVLATVEGDRESWTRANVEAETYRQLAAAGRHLAPGWEADIARVVEHVLHPDRCELISAPESVPIPARYLRADGSPVFVAHDAARYTSHTLKAKEAALVDAARRPAPVRRLTAAQVDRVLDEGAAVRGFAPSEEQRRVVRGVFTGDVRVRAVIGRAGTGKTTIMALVREVAHAHGIPVLGLASGQMQADALAERAGVRAENLARWRHMSEVHAPGTPEWTVPADAVVIVDEAGQADTGTLHALLCQVEAAGGRLLPIGDPRQLGAPGPAGVLDALASDADCLTLTEIRRFRDADGRPRTWEIEAARAVSEGDGDAAWRTYAERGRLHEGALDQVVGEVCAAWRRDVGEGLASVLIAPTNALAARLSHTVRAERIAAGLVDDRRTVPLADDQAAGVGDQLVTRVNDRRLTCENRHRQYVRNGDVWAVVAVTDEGGLRVRHTRTGGVLTLPADYRATSAELGYALTHSRAQGVTVHTAHALLLAGMDRNGAYPALTRGALENHGYLVRQPATDPETGELGPELTGRQLWAAIVARDGTPRTATARQRAALDESEALRTHEPRLRQVLTDLAEADTAEALARLLGAKAADQLTTAPAWPALRAQLDQLADEGVDTDRLLRRTYHERDFVDAEGKPVDDMAAILHARNRRALDPDDGGSPDGYRRREHAPRPATAATHLAPPVARGDDLLAALGLRLPAARPADGRDELRDYAHALARQLTDRAEALAASALDEARAGRGWAADYGPEPPDVANQLAWRDRLAAAAAYRDLANHRGADPTGPAPDEDHRHLRGLWRAAQPDDAPAPLAAARLAARPPRWLAVLGPRPEPGHRQRPLWDRAAHAVNLYRTLWDHGHETDALGPAPNDPVRAADHRAASRALARWHLTAAPENGDVSPDLVEARGHAARAHVEAAEAAADRFHAAERQAVLTAQEARDAANRAATVGTSADPRLVRRAEVARERARHAAEERDTARRALEELAPELLRAHADARRAAEPPRPAPAEVDARLEDAYREDRSPRPAPYRPEPPAI
ncbi:MobF family relaxase [Streptomyces sedi]|uniref:MobF family relaxase n=1 Tax=Streptomyces sedi TaxID=555059 RepID=UPI0014772601|nr:MobF family relaxase [Streptomyces sedi]